MRATTHVSKLQHLTMLNFCCFTCEPMYLFQLTSIFPFFIFFSPLYSLLHFSHFFTKIFLFTYFVFLFLSLTVFSFFFALISPFLFYLPLFFFFFFVLLTPILPTPLIYSYILLLNPFVIITATQKKNTKLFALPGSLLLTLYSSHIGVSVLYH